MRIAWIVQKEPNVDSLRFDGLTRDLAWHRGSRRQLLGRLVGGLLGGLGIAQFALVAPAKGRCRKGQHKCHGNCCPRRGPVCCKKGCCKKGFRCCGNKCCKK